jgi:hypothetical protein
LRRIGLIVALLLPALVPFPASAAVAVAEAGSILRGIVSTAQAPVGAGTMLLYDGANRVQSEPYQSFYNGIFAVRLNEAAASALSAGMFTAAYRNLRPATAVARADGTVAEALGVLPEAVHPRGCPCA